MAGNPIAEYNRNHIHVRGAEANELVLAEIVNTGYPAVAKTVRTICSVNPTEAWSLSGPNQIDQFNRRADNEAPDVVQAANRLTKLTNTRIGYKTVERILEKAKPRTATELDQVGHLVKIVKRINDSDEFVSFMNMVESLNHPNNEPDISELSEVGYFNSFEGKSPEEMVLRIACLIIGEEFHLAKRLTQSWTVGSKQINYQKQKRIAGESSDDEKLREWMKLLPEASQRDITEFRQVAANCLYHISDNISDDNNVKMSLNDAAICAYPKRVEDMTEIFEQGIRLERESNQDKGSLNCDEIDFFVAETVSLLDIPVPKIEKLAAQRDTIQNKNSVTSDTQTENNGKSESNAEIGDSTKTVQQTETETTDENTKITDSDQLAEEVTQNKADQVNKGTIEVVKSEMQKEWDSTYSDKQLSNLREQAEQEAQEQVQPTKTTKTAVKTQQYVRSNAVKEYVKARANGFCESCEERTPFENPQGKPYLHAHHVYELSDGGSDTVETVIALCPNCHYRVHHGKDGESFNKGLIEKLSQIEENPV